MFYYNYIEGLVPKAESVRLSVGRGVHIGLAAFYTHMTRAAGCAAYEEWVEKEVPQLMAEQADPTELEKSIELGRLMLDAYFDFAAENDSFVPLEVGKAKAIEASFRVPVWSPDNKRLRGVYQVGRFDGVVRAAAGRIWLLEHKTAKDFPNETYLRLDEQVGYYLLAAWQLFRVQPAGVIYNVIRKVDPRKARTETVKRFKVLRNGHELLYMRNSLYYAIQTIKKDKVFMPSPGLHCTWRCAYTQLCVCDHDGSDTSLLKEMFYIKTADGRRESSVAS
jgi:hypothetical protein